jgi:nitrous oxide reductase accessory protein NosL
MLMCCLVSILSSLTVTPAAGRQGCTVCGMYIDVYQQTAANLTYKDGRQVSTCGVACMIRLVNDAGGPDAFKAITVRDFETGETVAAAAATYVIGSKVVPDMLPNLIAFGSSERAREFQDKEGGELISFTQALLSISPMGMTMPARIKSAVLPGRGTLATGIGVMYMTMDEVKLGSDSIDPLAFVQRPMQMMGPKKMETRGEMLMVSYGLSDRINVDLQLADLHKEMEMYIMGGKAVSTTKNNGIGDLTLNLRYNIWKDTMYRRFLTLLAGTTIPTGEFETEFLNSPGMQTGRGDFSGTVGLIFSNRFRDLWFHYMVSQTAFLENSDDYKFGDVTHFGAAVHYTPNYDLLLGMEVDGTDSQANEFHDIKIGNTGGFRSYLTGVGNWKFLTALGGNFSVRLAGGLPLYEDMDHLTSGSPEKVQLGEGYFYNFMLSFKRRFLL